jgi:hypothetical protein
VLYKEGNREISESQSVSRPSELVYASQSPESVRESVLVS